MSLDFAAPDPKPHRQWAIYHGAIRDHRGSVNLEPIEHFDLNRTIFGTLRGALPRFITRRRIAQRARWTPEILQEIQHSFQALRTQIPPEVVHPQLVQFLREHCDFSSEHADGSFWEHLYFGYEYCQHHYPQHSPRVMLLHSILGTGTNTFAMPAHKMPQLRALVTEFEWRHIEAFPSLLRLLYEGSFLDALDKAHTPSGLRCHRVIDNAPLYLSAQDLQIQLNYQLMHLIDFVPIANWYTQRSDPSFIVFRRLYNFLTDRKALELRLGYPHNLRPEPSLGAIRPLRHRWVDHLPKGVVQHFGARAIRQFSQAIGHDLGFELCDDSPHQTS